MLARLSRRPVTSVLRSSRAFPSGRGNNRLISRRQYISDKNSYEEWKEDFLANIRRKGLLLKGNMTSRKFISLPWPPSTTTTRYTFTFSDLAGHTSFLFLALSYLENDFLHLRLYALSGITMSIIFQYYREKPLWIPIRWNSLFFLINSIMICLLLKKQTDAENLPEDQKQLYYKVFQAKGMTPVEFLQLISIAKRLEAKPNDKLVDQHKTNTRLYLVVKGNLTVLKNEQKVGTIKDNQFVGAMSFLNWQSRVHEDLLHRKELEEQGWSTPWEEHIASVFSLTRKKKVHEVIREAHAANKAKQQQEEASAEGVATLAATTSIATGAEAGISEGLLAAGMIKTTSDVDGNALAGVVTNTATGTTEDESQTLKAEFDSDSLVVNPANASTDPLAADGNVDEGVANTGSILEDGHLASADAVCDDECIVYYWKFKDLRYLMQDYPMLGLVFERCISDDLNQKMTSTWDEELKIRYKQLLTGALMDGEVNEKARMMLSEFRQTYQISEQDHEEMLQQLSWTIDDYEAGHKDGPSADIRQQYTELLRQEIEQPYGLSEDGRQALRVFRQKHHIHMETHLQALRSLGWTFDQYEVGAKDEQVLQLRQEREMKQNKQYLAEKEKLKALQRYLALQAAQEAEANKHDSSLAAASTASKAKHDSHWLVRRPVLNWLYRQWYGSETNHNSTDTTNSVPMTNTNNAILLELIQEQEEVDGEREHTPSLDIINCSTTASMGDL